ncbi:alpha-mannosidase [Paenibacillus psychroresistens]|uniref:Alpha-mannosidase n=1 Tax=Paenibacillus psychroresistens TaxID=1778678 RepID=A0A6B8RX49_9BACL|nr:alpha-mannosidase [Paenibacillus psychroresistens]QGQ99736.1 alpha-mannosidase [Paenibacillus psychroresistens]
MAKKRTAHIISHTHWDREWYLPYEKHHVQLIQLMDTLLDTMERDPDYRSFFLDGQTIILEDYLQVRPEKKVQLEALIRAERIYIGPWYILQDAFLTSSEANIRNLQIGHQDAKRYGKIAKVGYFPDTFGNIGQAPQIMQQAGINNAVFGRGVKPTGFNNMVSDSDYESSFSELIWEGPDGSRVLGILFANWYSNGNEIPTDETEAKVYWERKLADAEKYASTNQLLFMNGCDHQPIQQDLSEAIRTAEGLYPDTAFVHSSFADYLQAVNETLKQDLSMVKGELRSQRTDGWSTLVNTASSRVYLKQMNQVGQTLLEKVAEPLASFAALVGKTYPHHLFTYAWKTLMQNHPHDSICGCSVDEVHREMITRFDKSRHVTETIVEDSKRAIAEAVDTSIFAQIGEDALPFIVFNTSGWKRSGTVSVELDVERVYFRDGFSLEEMNLRMKGVSLESRILVDTARNSLAYKVEDKGVQFGYDLPDDKFRQPYMCRKVILTFEAEQVPALGMKAYAWTRVSDDVIDEADSSGASLITSAQSMENEWIKLVIAEDGSFTLTEKKGNRTYYELGVYEDTGDIGNEYMYKQPNGELPFTTKGLLAEIQILEDTPYRASLEIIHHWQIPASGDEKFEQEKQELIYFPERQGKRVSQMIPLEIRTVVRLNRNGKGVEIESSFNNQAKDHRIRMLFPTDLVAATHSADSIFEVVQRDNQPAAEWENPSNCQHQQAFVDVSSEEAGLTIANLGLNEYEILRDGRNTIAITLLRSTGELGDWGLFPTPEAQCLGEHTARLEIIPHSGDGVQTGAYAEAYQYQIPWTVCQTGIHEGSIAPIYAPVAWEGEALAFSSMKINEASGDLMLRWFNMNNSNSELVVHPDASYNQIYKSNVLEEQEKDVTAYAVGPLSLPVGRCEILTLGINRLDKE